MTGLGVRPATALAVMLALTAAPAPASADGDRDDPPRRYQLVTQNDRGKVADESSFGPSVSRDGSLVAFGSRALNLDPRVRPRRSRQVYLWDARTRRVRAAVRRPGGGLTSDAEVPSLSANGRFLAFCSRDPKLVRPDSLDGGEEIPDSDEDVFVADLRTDEVRRASSDFRGREADGYSCSPRVSNAGDVVFSSRATDLVRGDTDEVPDVFLYDWSSERVRLLTTAEVGDQAFDISADGSTVAVVTTEALVGRDTQTYSDLYLYRRSGGGLRGRWELGLPRADGSATTTGVDFTGVDISRDGRFVTGFSNDGGIVSPPLSNDATRLWVRDRRTGRVWQVNRGEWQDEDLTDVQVGDDGRTVIFRGDHLMMSKLLLWRRGRGVSSLTEHEDVWSSPAGLDLSGDGEWAAFTMIRYDLPDADPLSPGRMLIYRTRVR